MSDSAVCSRVSFYSKARSLQEIAQLLTTARVLPSVVFTVAQWDADSDAMVSRILDELGGAEPWIVRSSSLSEDGALFSNAGRFLSVPDVGTISGLKDAVARVIASYGRNVRVQDEILIQPMAQKLIASGVATTCDVGSGLGYRVINITHQSRSNAVTSGDSACAACVYLSPHRPPTGHACHPIFDMLEELSALTAGLPIDVEFGVDAQGVVLFQLRRLTAMKGACTSVFETKVKACVEAAMMKVGQLLARDEQLGPTALGVMPDWNPAEMIGLKPRPLSFDLYARLMTDRAWALGRVPFGYRNMSHLPLMHQVAGTPYIDIAASVQSLLPASLPTVSVRTVVRAALARLRAEPQLHDKMELTVLPTCLTAEMVTGGVPSSLQMLEPARRTELIEGLRLVTREVVRRGGPFYTALHIVEAHLPMVECLNARPATLSDASSLIATARNVLAPRFSLIARAAFVATALLRSLEKNGVLRPGFFDAFSRGIRTVSHDISSDVMRLSRDDFVRRYGHVRPGTYDIRVPNYADGDARYFSERDSLSRVPIDLFEPVELLLTEMRAAEALIGELALGVSLSELLEFSRRAIAGRELAKFIYSGYVSHTLEAIARSGQGMGFDLDSLSYLDLSSALQLASASSSDVAALRARIDRRRDGWQTGVCIRVPYLLFDASELLGFDEFHSQPNYVTTREVVGRVVTLDESTTVSAEDCTDAVVMMEAADPGYDWIFAAGIAGLITAFGGENSHMAIRAREFDIPAVIGVGGRQFAALAVSRALRINCAERRIEVLH